MTSVLDKGYVKLRDSMGSDLTVVNAARVSFQKESDWAYTDHQKIEPEGEVKWWVESQLKEVDKNLVHFLARSGHWSPFAHPKVSLEVKAPLLVVNQWYRTAIDSVYSGEHHAWNEASRRYVTMEPEFYVPEAWRSAPESKKQGSGGEVPESTQTAARIVLFAHFEECLDIYNRMLGYNIAPEQARLVLPAYALYTSFYWTASLSTVIRWLKERLADDAQWEIRQYANAVQELVRPLFPESFAAHDL